MYSHASSRCLCLPWIDLRRKGISDGEMLLVSVHFIIMGMLQ